MSDRCPFCSFDPTNVNDFCSQHRGPALNVSRSRAPQEGLQAELCEALLKVANAITAQMSGESRRMDKYPLRPSLAVVIEMQQAARDGDLIIVTPPEKEPSR